ncbi:hypothetical protein BS50DRAFT_638340 [Corynespora cassiicola Philippines]|uniref:Uncharacterized protein n=1 Tax=Corynespora cassiicola Philippines TaxID=1448308 RepID=A0A2T2NBB6_CORCC|nr:hypothetical protein BS50DRAFT_638340 [Corynespora cassiicola Philippines]
MAAACATANPIDVSFEPNPEWSHRSPLDLPTIDRSIRSSLLKSEPIILRIRHSGAQHGFLCQNSNRPLLKHFHRPSFHHELLHSDPKNDDSYLFRFPLNALLASSTYLSLCFEVRPASEIIIHLGNLFPGFVKEVLDWYAEALEADTWFEFPIFEDWERIWYYYYIYATMRVLGMHKFTVNLQVYLVNRLNSDIMPGLSDISGLSQVLQHLHSRDPVAQQITQTCAPSIGNSDVEVERLQIAGGMDMDGLDHGNIFRRKRNSSVEDTRDGVECALERSEGAGVQGAGKGPFRTEIRTVDLTSDLKDADMTSSDSSVDDCMSDNDMDADARSACGSIVVKHLDYDFEGYIEGDMDKDIAGNG